jgi:tRNA(Glu) U13 pseudouridine synthase TruD
MLYISKPDDFIVEEIIKPKFTQKFMRTDKGVVPVNGRHALYILKKKNLTTEQALKKLNIEFHQIGFAGLKDKHAITSQYITIKDGKPENICKKNLSLTYIQNINRKIHIGDLKENRFTITVHRNIEAPKILRFKNYFGPQRFSRRNQIIGRRILQTRTSTYDKARTKFFIHAYQSFIFNKALQAYDKPPRYLPLVGYNTKPDKISKQLLEQDKLTTKSFRLLGLTCIGGKRATILKTKIKHQGNKLIFSLPPGSYATVVLKELGIRDLR